MRRIFLIGVLLLLSLFVFGPAAIADTHCGSNRACIENVAKTSCQKTGDPWHCRIYYRNVTHILEPYAHIAWVPVPDTSALAPPKPKVPPGVDGIPGMTPLDWCVFGRESSHNFYIDTGNGYLGGFQWEWTTDYSHGTYQSVLDMMGSDYEAGRPGGVDTQGWSRNPLQATPAQQVAAFNYWSVRDPSAWPNTLPACGGA